MKKKLEKHYCSKCGGEMFDFLCEADKVKIGHSGGMDVYYTRLASAYDTKTGERNYATIFQCYNYKDNFFWNNGHDVFLIYKEEKHYSPKL